MLIPPEVVDYLRLHHIVTLSTSSFTGMPHANTVAYAIDESAIYFGAPSDTTIVRNLRDNRYASFTIDDYTTEWRKIRELQGVGESGPVEDAERAHVEELFHERFRSLPVESLGILHRIRPLEVHFVDFEYASEGERQTVPQATSRVYQLEGGREDAPAHGAVSTSLDSQAFSAGDVIFRPGDAAGQFFVIVSGEIELRGEGYGADQTIARLGPGQLFGDQAALRGQRGAFTAHAVSDTMLLAVDRRAVRDLLVQQP